MAVWLLVPGACVTAVCVRARRRTVQARTAVACARATPRFSAALRLRPNATASVSRPRCPARLAVTPRASVRALRTFSAATDQRLVPVGHSVCITVPTHRPPPVDLSPSTRERCQLSRAAETCLCSACGHSNCDRSGCFALPRHHQLGCGQSCWSWICNCKGN